MDFAKTYQTDKGQILALMETDEEDKPCIKFYAKPESLGVCCVSLSFNDTEEGWNQCEKVFSDITQEKAEGAVATIYTAADAITPDNND